VSTKTFFNYFPSKADVLFADPLANVEAALRVISDRGPDDGIREVLLRAVDALLATAEKGDQATAVVRQRLIVTVPVVQAVALRHLLEAQARLADALWGAFPGELDPISAAALVGALLGAMIGGIQASLRQDLSEQEMLTAIRRAIELAGQCLPTTATTNPPTS